MPGNYGNSEDAFRLGPARKNLWDQLPFGSGMKRKFSEHDTTLAGPSTSHDAVETAWSGKRHCLRDALEGGRHVEHLEPSTSMDCDNFPPEMSAKPSIYPSSLYSHMAPYAGTPPAPHRSNRPDFPRAAALCNLSHDAVTEAAAHQFHTQQRDERPPRNCHRETQSAFCNDYCRNGTESPNSQFIRCFCRPSWEGMMSAVPMGNDYY